MVATAAAKKCKFLFIIALSLKFDIIIRIDDKPVCAVAQDFIRPDLQNTAFRRLVITFHIVSVIGL